MTADPKPSVLFVCMGNICRSPTGEGLFRHLVEARGLDDRIDIDSAGTIAHHAGEPPDPRMTRSAAGRGYRLGGRARQVRPDDVSRFDLIIAMDRQNLQDLEALGPQWNGRVRLLSDFLPEGSAVDVPDPYYGGEQGFQTVIDMIEEACPAVLDHLTAGS
ncbi:MAG: low molecular weight protein-tyrosine-phosphatase [Acidobacteriota bacterium]